MEAGNILMGRTMLRRSLALIACTTLVHFAFVGALPHQHAHGPDNACHVCQALHVPALAAARLDLISRPEIVTWHSSLPEQLVSSEPLALHRASRAPPTA
jgi:hypothetical protein